ncbi:hypothetical protein M8044_000436 [Columbia Basin potato purple top phytoplasma]|uniref:Sequence-variable mosaic (SVM) signal sequence domain-containing protein n=2 Tax=Columbia Basin potato purple top phytoplasma TaxID=307134 RepID=A0ABT5L9M3_9MOLU|nr:hypothetical protein [Columbia Basin potato purple top phytoplasma]
MKRKKFFLKKVNFFLFFFVLYFSIFNLYYIKAINNDKKNDDLSMITSITKEEPSVSDINLNTEEKKDNFVIKKIQFNDNNSVFKDLKKQKETSSSNNKVDDLSIFFDSKNEEITVLKKEYKKDSNAKHPIIGWKHDLGCLFSKKIRVFYNVGCQIQTVPCASFQECLNIKQFIFSLLDKHIPKIDFLFNFLDFSGLKETFIDNRYEKTSLEFFYFFSLLKKDPSLGYFYFKDIDIPDIHSVNISFCNCKVPGYSILDLIIEIINLENEDLIIFKKHLMNYFAHLNKMDEKQISHKEMDILTEEFLENVLDFSDIETLDKNFLLHLIKKLSIYFVPKFFSFHCSVDYKNTKPIKEINFELSLEKEHKTIGFLLQIQKNEDDVFYLCFYEIFQDEYNNDEKLRFIERVLIFNSKTKEHSFFNHLAINIKQNKKIFLKKANLFGVSKI